MQTGRNMTGSDQQLSLPPAPALRSPALRSAKLALAALAVAALGITGCGSITKTSGPSTAAPAAQASTSAIQPPSPSSSLSGPVGTVYTVTDQSGDKISVTLTRVIDPAQGADQFTTPDNGNRFVGAVFSIKGISGTFSDDANS